MRRADFMDMTFAEYAGAVKSWSQAEQNREMAAWERMRTLAAISVQPWSKKAVDARQLLPLPWDKGQEDTAAAAISREDARKRFDRLMAARTTEHDTQRDGNDTID